MKKYINLIGMLLKAILPGRLKKKAHNNLQKQTSMFFDKSLVKSKYLKTNKNSEDKNISNDKTINDRLENNQITSIPNVSLLEDDKLIENMFLKIRDDFYKSIDGMTNNYTINPVKKTIIKEAGYLTGKRPYFFLQPLNEEGWLFERSGAGWVISRAHKIVNNDSFIRKYESWDIVTLYQTENSLLRVSSKRFGGDLISFYVYEKKLHDSLKFDYV